MPQNITEHLTLEAASPAGDGSLLVEFITPGWGSSGYYSPQVVEAAAPLFAVGTHLYLDHPTATEDQERPVRSVKDLAAVITEAGTWSNGGIRGKVKPFGPYRDLLLDEDFAKNIGLSIRASASDIVIGEAEGRKGPIIESLVNLKSVDFVTRAGRGGRVLQVLESAGLDVQEARNIGQWVESRIHRDFTVMADDMAGDGRLTREERIGLSSAIGDALAAFVASLEANQPQLYTRDIWANPQDTVAAAMEAAKNVPATRPDSTTPTEESKEDPMAEVTIEETELARLRDDAGRVQTLESERDTARNDLAIERRTNRARTLIAEADASFTPLEQRGLLADLPVNEDGTLDEAAFTTTVTEAAAASEAARGVGSVRGFGSPTQHTEDELTEADLDKKVAGAFGRTIKEA